MVGGPRYTTHKVFTFFIFLTASGASLSSRTWAGQKGQPLLRAQTTSPTEKCSRGTTGRSSCSCFCRLAAGGVEGSAFCSFLTLPFAEGAASYPMSRMTFFLGTLRPLATLSAIRRSSSSLLALSLAVSPSPSALFCFLSFFTFLAFLPALVIQLEIPSTFSPFLSFLVAPFSSSYAKPRE